MPREHVSWLMHARKNSVEIVYSGVYVQNASEQIPLISREWNSRMDVVTTKNTFVNYENRKIRFKFTDLVYYRCMLSAKIFLIQF